MFQQFQLQFEKRKKKHKTKEKQIILLMKRHIYDPLSAKKMLNCLITQRLIRRSSFFCLVGSIKILTDIIKELF